MIRPRLPGFGSALGAQLLVLTSACGGAGSLKVAAADASHAESSPGLPAASVDAPAAAGALAEASPSAPTRAMIAAPVPNEAGGASAPSAPPPPSSATAIASAPSREMLDIEARVALRVQNVRRAVKALHELAARSGGVVTTESVDGAGRHASAELTLRVPSNAASNVFRDLEAVGTVLSQNVTAREIGKEFFDANLRLSNLTATLRRYEEILAKADKVEELLRIEQELARIRGEIEQVKGDLRWLSDRAARATLHVSLREVVPELAVTEEPEAKFFPGLRAPLLIDLGQRERLHVGGGISLRFARAFSVDLDILRRTDGDAGGPDTFLATAGGELYSELLGDGRRRFLNPYLGLRAGYGRFDDHDQAVVGATLGVELFKHRTVMVDVETRHYLAFVGELGAHYVLVPALTASVAF